MKRNRKFSMHFELSHSILFNNYPATYTDTIGVPGKYVKKINRRVHLKDGALGEMDSAYIAEPDNKILFEKVAVGLEHQSIPVSDSKLNMIGNYDIQLVVDEHLPTLIAVASHLKKEKSKSKLIRSPSDITELYFLNLGEENICERLNKVSKIIDSKECLSTENALNLGVIALYAPRNRACEIMKRVVNLYLKIVNNINFKMEFTLYSVITILVDAFFDDEKEYRGLIDMIDEKTSNQTRQRFPSEEAIIESLKYAQEDLAIANNDLAIANADLDEANARIANLEEEIRRLKKHANAK